MATRRPQPSDTFHFPLFFFCLNDSLVCFSRGYSRRHELIRPLSRAAHLQQKQWKKLRKQFFFLILPILPSPRACLRRARAAKSVYIRIFFLRDLNWSRESLLITWRNSSRGCDGSSSPRPCTHYKLGALFAHESRSCSVQFSFTLSNESRCVFSESIRLRGIAVKTENSHNSLVSLLIRLKNIFLFYVI